MQQNIKTYDNKIIKLTKNIKLNVNISHLMHLLPPSTIVNFLLLFIREKSMIISLKLMKVSYVKPLSVSR